MNKGFSLVELIVVIAIMAILVGVAVPTYSAYIGKAQAGVEADTLGQIVYAAKLANVEHGTTASLVISDEESVVITFTGDNADDAIAQVMEVMADVDDELLTSDTDKDTITYTISKLTADDIEDIDTSF